MRILINCTFVIMIFVKIVLVAVYLMGGGTFYVSGMPSKPKSTAADRATRTSSRFLKAILTSHPWCGGICEAHSRICAAAAGRPGHTAQGWRL